MNTHPPAVIRQFPSACAVGDAKVIVLERPRATEFLRQLSTKPAEGLRLRNIRSQKHIELYNSLSRDHQRELAYVWRLIVSVVDQRWSIAKETDLYQRLQRLKRQLISSYVLYGRDFSLESLKRLTKAGYYLAAANPIPRGDPRDLFYVPELGRTYLGFLGGSAKGLRTLSKTGSPVTDIDDIRFLLNWSMLGRALPVPSERQIAKAIDIFKASIQRLDDTSFLLQGSVWNHAYNWGEAHRLLRPERISTYTHVSLSRKACYEFSRSKGGKLSEYRRIISKYWDESTPTGGPFYDIFGRIAIKEGSVLDLGSDLYSSDEPDDLIIKDHRDAKTSPSIGLKLLFFCITEGIRLGHLSVEGGDFENLPLSSVRSRMQIRYRNPAPSKVVPLAEYGLKTRVITEPPFWVNVIGMVMRHICQRVMRRDPRLRVGLEGKNPIWLLHRKLRLEQEFALSSDLTNATDNVPLSIASSVLEGWLAGLGFRGPFIRFLVEVTTGQRRFHYKGEVINNHRTGVMMGEPMTFVVLNILGLVSVSRSLFTDDMTLTGRSLLPQNLKFSFGQVGDDRLVFSEDISILKKIPMVETSHGLICSEKNIISDRLATLCEEFLIKCDYTDNRGTTARRWIFIDLIKPRFFAPGETTYAWLGKIAAMDRQIQWLGAAGTFDSVPAPASFIAEALFRNLPRLPQCGVHRLAKAGIPIGYNSSFGGINHPIGRLADYWSTLPKETKYFVWFLTQPGNPVWKWKAQQLLKNEDHSVRVPEVQNTLEWLASVPEESVSTEFWESIWPEEPPVLECKPWGTELPSPGQYHCPVVSIPEWNLKKLLAKEDPGVAIDVINDIAETRGLIYGREILKRAEARGANALMIQGQEEVPEPTFGSIIRRWRKLMKEFLHDFPVPSVELEEPLELKRFWGAGYFYKGAVPEDESDFGLFFDLVPEVRPPRV